MARGITLEREVLQRGSERAELPVTPAFIIIYEIENNFHQPSLFYPDKGGKAATEIQNNNFLQPNNWIFFFLQNNPKQTGSPRLTPYSFKHSNHDI